MGVLHTFKGMIGYCIHDNDKEHFESAHHNVLVEDTNDKKTEYLKWSLREGWFELLSESLIATLCKGLINGRASV